MAGLLDYLTGLNPADLAQQLVAAPPANAAASGSMKQPVVIDYLTGNDAAASPWGVLYQAPPDRSAAAAREAAAYGMSSIFLPQSDPFGDPSKFTAGPARTSAPPTTGFGKGAVPFGFAGPGSMAINAGELGPKPMAPSAAPAASAAASAPTDASSVNRQSVAAAQPDNVVNVGNYRMPVYGERPEVEQPRVPAPAAAPVAPFSLGGMLAAPATSPPAAQSIPAGGGAPAAADPAASPFSLDGIGASDGRLMKGARGLIGNMHNGPIGALLGGLGAVITGQETDPSSIAAQKTAKAESANVRWLASKGATAEEQQAASGNPALMTALIQKYTAGPKAPTSLGSGYVWNPANGKIERAFEPDDKTPAGFRKTEDGLEPIPNGPADPAYIARQTAATGTSNVNAQVEQRKQAAAAIGLNPDHPAYQGYILTGKMPREDAQPLTATDKKAILEADEAVLTNKSVIDALKRAGELSDQAFYGPTAEYRAKAASLLGSSSDLGKSGIATQELNNVVTSNALAQLKATFGAAPTEGERKILLDIQGSVDQPPEVRKRIYARAAEMAQKRLEFNQQRAAELRGGNFYKPQGSMSRAPVQQSQGITQQEYEALPSGATFTAPDGTQRVKP
ncbi:hypothetical protein Rpal_3070 [Rhodopseudomonas palustris TIE-1]|uniref:hypothetical protein n=1 Tax=Rhodopseudomonas palustris TaxID=1076 RepID=UPI000164A5ED|nr:hypothetical protein [Rhodopseudomonas palustris]ACF01576.1 hypothetical protein Rpal_3070 [Rhodopseudomonas palustris TIE-1]